MHARCRGIRNCWLKANILPPEISSLVRSIDGVTISREVAANIELLETSESVTFMNSYSNEFSPEQPVHDTNSTLIEFIETAEEATFVDRNENNLQHTNELNENNICSTENIAPHMNDVVIECATEKECEEIVETVDEIIEKGVVRIGSLLKELNTVIARKNVDAELFKNTMLVDECEANSYETAAKNWFNVEEEAEIQNSIVEDEIDAIDSIVDLVSEEDVEEPVELENEKEDATTCVNKQECYAAITICQQFVREKKLPLETMNLIKSFELSVRDNLLSWATATRSIKTYFEST